MRSFASACAGVAAGRDSTSRSPCAGVSDWALTDELGPIDLGRIDPRSFGRIWTKLFASLDREALTPADD